MMMELAKLHNGWQRELLGYVVLLWTVTGQLVTFWGRDRYIGIPSY
jgi:hypothetical protein